MIFDPPDWATYELAIMRGLLFLVLVRMIPSAPPRQGPTRPVGLARLIDLYRLDGRIYAALRVGLAPAGVLFVIAATAPFGAAYLAIVVVLSVTLESSQGSMDHGRHLPMVAVVAQFAGGVGYGLADLLDWQPSSLILHDAGRTMTWWTVQATMAVYFVSGVSKLARSGFMWVGEAHHLGVTTVARAETGLLDQPRRTDRRDRAARIAGGLSSHRLIAMLVFGGGLWLELAAPFALVNRVTLLVGGLAFIALHRSIGVFLLLPFRRYQWTLLIFFVNVPYLVVEAVGLLG